VYCELPQTPLLDQCDPVAVERLLAALNEVGVRWQMTAGLGRDGETQHYRCADAAHAVIERPRDLPAAVEAGIGVIGGAWTEGRRCR